MCSGCHAKRWSEPIISWGKDGEGLCTCKRALGVWHTSAQCSELHKPTVQHATCKQAAGNNLSREVASEGLVDFDLWTTNESAAE